MVVRFAEQVGAPAVDSLEGSTGTVTFGLAGDDFLTSRSGSAFSILIGGSGDDTYASKAGTTVTVADRGGSANDVLVTQSLGPSSDAFTALVDGRHFMAYDQSSGETVFILDFLRPENYIEQIRTPDGTFSTIDLWNFAQQQPSYLGNVSWEGLNAYGITHPYSTADTNEAIAYYGDRANALEVVAPIADDGSVFRFFNTQTGTHFYTADAAERDTVIQTLPQYRFEGEVFDTPDEGTSDTIDVYRFYNTQTGSHFYTSSDEERAVVQATLANYRFEGEAYQAYDEAGEGRTAVYRFYNTQTDTHFYTADAAEQQTVIETLPQFRYEGIGYYVDL